MAPHSQKPWDVDEPRGPSINRQLLVTVVIYAITCLKVYHNFVCNFLLCYTSETTSMWLLQTDKGPDNKLTHLFYRKQSNLATYLASQIVHAHHF